MKNKSILRIGITGYLCVYILCLGLFVFPAFILAEDYSWRGGAVRCSALGGVLVALPDSASVMDLFEQGFASCLVMRPQKSLLNISIGAIPREFREEAAGDKYGLSDHPLFLSGEGGGTRGFQLFIDRDNAVLVSPYLMLNEGVQSTVEGQFSDSMNRNMLENLYAMDVVFSRRIAGSFFGGAVLRAAFFRDESATEQNAYIGFDDLRINTSEKILYSKAEYSISGAYMPDAGFTAAAAFGRLKQLSPSYEPWIAAMKNAGFAGALNVYPALFSGYSSTRSVVERTLGSLWESTVIKEEKLGVTGYCVGAGCSLRGKGHSVFTVSADMTLGITAGYSGSSSTVIDMYYGADSDLSGSSEYVKIENGFSYRITILGRYDLGGFIASGRFNYSAAGAGMPETAGHTVSLSLQALDAVLGTAFVSERLKIPVEIFTASLFQKETGGTLETDSGYSLFEAGLRGGVEYELGSGIFMRLGFDAAYGGPSSTVKNKSGTDITQLGTSANPAYVQYSIGFGAGHSTEATEINFNLKYSNTGRLPYVPGYMKYEAGAMIIMTDVKVYL